MLPEAKSLPEKIYYGTEVLPVDKYATFLLRTFKFNFYSVLFFQMVTCTTLPN